MYIYISPYAYCATSKSVLGGLESPEVSSDLGLQMTFLWISVHCSYRVTGVPKVNLTDQALLRHWTDMP